MPRPRPTRQLHPVAAWAVGLLTAVLTAALIGWLGVWGLVPGGSSPAPSAEPVAPTTPADELPFTLAVDAKPDICGAGYVIPAAPGAFPDPPADGSYDAWHAWARTLGGVPARSNQVTMTIQGRSEAQVTLTDLAVEVVQRRPAIAATTVWRGCGGPTAYRWVAVDLDTDPPRLSTQTMDEVAENVPAQERRPIRFPYRVSISDAETFEIDGAASDCDCSWRIKLHWAAEGRTGVAIVDDHGEPFRTTGDANATHFCVRPTADPVRCWVPTAEDRLPPDTGG